MGFVDWQRFKAEQLAAFGTDTAGRDAKAAASTKAEAMHQGREAEVAAKIAELDATAKTLLDDAKKKGEPAPAQDSDADKRLKAENALYERNLQAFASKRSERIIAKASLADGRSSVADVERLSAELREVLHRAAMYGNEAYITGATVLHVVGNLQLLKGSEDVSIELSADDYLASANEQVGFIFDDFHREHGDVQAGLLKAGKYISQLGHAAANVEAQVTQALAGRGMVHKPLANPSSTQVQKYGEELMRIKEKVAPADQKTALGSAAVGGWTLSGKGLQQVKTELLQVPEQGPGPRREALARRGAPAAGRAGRGRARRPRHPASRRCGVRRAHRRAPPVGAGRRRVVPRLGVRRPRDEVVAIAGDGTWSALTAHLDEASRLVDGGPLDARPGATRFERAAAGDLLAELERSFVEWVLPSDGADPSAGRRWRELVVALAAGPPGVSTHGPLVATAVDVVVIQLGLLPADAVALSVREALTDLADELVDVEPDAAALLRSAVAGSGH